MQRCFLEIYDFDHRRAYATDAPRRTRAREKQVVSRHLVFLVLKNDQRSGLNRRYETPKKLCLAITFLEKQQEQAQNKKYLNC